jgi:hypothetical protein
MPGCSAAQPVEPVLAVYVVGEPGVGLRVHQLPAAVGQAGPDGRRTREAGERPPAPRPLHRGVPRAPCSVELIGRHEHRGGQQGHVELLGDQQVILAKGGVGQPGGLFCRTIGFEGVGRKVGKQHAAGQTARLGMVAKQPQASRGLLARRGVAAGNVDELGLKPHAQGCVGVSDLGDGPVEHSQGTPGVARAPP